jgi:hypothetical protein
MYNTLSNVYHLGTIPASPHTVPTFLWLLWSNYAECFVTSELTPQGGAATTFVFGDHAFLTYQGICYDPSFVVEYTGSWDQYMRSIMAQGALPDISMVTAWTRCDGTNNPQNVVDRGFATGGVATNHLTLKNFKDGTSTSWELQD